MNNFIILNCNTLPSNLQRGILLVFMSLIRGMRGISLKWHHSFDTEEAHLSALPCAHLAHVILISFYPPLCQSIFCRDFVALAWHPERSNTSRAYAPKSHPKFEERGLA